MASRKLTVALDEWIDPERVFVALYEREEYAFWLDTGQGASKGVSYLGAASATSRVALASVADRRVRVLTTGPDAREIFHPGTIFDFLRRPEAWAPRGVPLHRGGDGPAADHTATDHTATDHTATDRTATDRTATGRTGDPSDLARHPFGWVGWLGYEAGADALRIPARATETPDAALLWADRMIAFDHSTRKVTLVVDDVADASAWIAGTIERIRSADLAAPVERSPSAPPGPARWRHDDAAYLRMIEECRLAIERGDAYQICLTNEVRVDPAGDPFDIYLRLRRLNETHHGGYLRFGEFALLSSSPEQFLNVKPDGKITTRPIKGTRQRGATPDADDALRSELLASEKERAENVMIVDLMRNDLSRVCDPGTVEVDSLLEVETYPHVHQLVSSVSGRLAPGRTIIDAIQACFPAGSMTGAPKQSAMRILHRIENGPRGVYAGCFGYLASDGTVDLAMVIRSIVLDGNGASIGTGGGITALSTPHDELAEAKLKASVLLEALSPTAPALRPHR